ncbi:MAG: nucleotidyltransferase family protein, partial [Bacteroidota bacterium]
MTQSEIYYFAGKCLILDKNPEFRKKVLEVCQNDLMDWKQFVAICSNNLILPAICLKFRSHNILEHLPHDLSEHLLEIYELNRERNNLIVEQIKSITAVLNGQNIFPLFFKGAGNLIDDVYSDIGERLMYDIDFLVPEKDFLTSAEIMMDHGYLSYSEIDFLENLPNLKVLPKWMHHYPALYHPDFPASIEIHRMPTHNKSKWFNQGIINAEKKAASTLKGCFVPSFQHRIIHNFIHSQLSHKGYLFGNIPL